MNMILLIRVFLLIAYITVSFPVALLFIGSPGLGSHAPKAILFSWGILPLEYASSSGVQPSVASVFVALVFLVFYLLCLFSLTTFCARSSRVAIAFSPLLMHIVGVAVALIIVTRNGWHGVDATPAFLATSYITAALLGGAYVLADWLLARKPNKGAAPNGGLAAPLDNSGVSQGPPSVS
jgi:hypothetical protein